MVSRSAGATPAARRAARTRSVSRLHEVRASPGAGSSAKVKRRILAMSGGAAAVAVASTVIVAALLKQYGVELILHGHDHVHSTMWFDGPDRPIPAIGVPSASALAHGRYPAAAYNLFSIWRDGGAWRCEQTGLPGWQGAPSRRRAPSRASSPAARGRCPRARRRRGRRQGRNCPWRLTRRGGRRRGPRRPRLKTAQRAGR